MTTISADILCDSVNPEEGRLTTFQCVFPRFILAEVNTHRALSRNSASSRAIPVRKAIDRVWDYPAAPVRWGKAGPGMQDAGELNEDEEKEARRLWEAASVQAVYHAEFLNDNKVHKQIANRVLEPFAWHTAVISGTDWAGFFRQRVHPAAQPEFQRLAHLMLLAYVDHEPTRLNWGEWHVPFGDRMPDGLSDEHRLKVATARCARVSYLTHDGAIDIFKDLDLFNRLAGSDPKHLSPLEHVAEAKPGRHANFVGWEQLRKRYETASEFDPADHLRQYEATLNKGT